MQRQLGATVMATPTRRRTMPPVEVQWQGPRKLQQLMRLGRLPLMLRLKQAS